MFNLLSKDIAVLDITSRYISAIVGVKKAQSVFGIKTIYEKPNQGFIDGEWLDQDDTIAVAKDVLKYAMCQAGSKTRKLFIGVPSEFISIVTKDLIYNLDRTRRVTEDDILEIIQNGNKFKTDKYVTVNVSTIFFTIDDNKTLFEDIIGMEASKIKARVSYSMCEVGFIDMFNGVSKSLGFNDVKYVPVCLAEAKNLLEVEQRRDYAILVDISYLSSSISLVKGKGIVDMKSFSMGGGNITADIFEGLDVSFELAEESKTLVDLNLNYGEEAILVSDVDSTVYGLDVSEITKARLDVIAEILSDVIKDYESKFVPNIPVYLTGDGIASIRGAKKYIADSIGKNIEIVTPKIPGFVKPEDSSKISLLMMAESLPKYNFIKAFKSMIYGGNN